MIVQNAPDDRPRFVITMLQHTTFAGQMARHFGNDEFSPLDPAEPLQFVVANHDRGWDALDGRAPQDPDTGLPYHLTETPLSEVIDTSAGSPAFNEKRHPLSGLISSMHTYGLYHGRYGLAPDKVSFDRIADEVRPRVKAMLDGELARQHRLRADLAADPATAAWNNETVIFTAYKQLQFFDTLSLYFHMQAEGLRGASTFNHVPTGPTADVSISVTEEPDAVYRLDPYPFDLDRLQLATEGRYLRPAEPGTDLATVMAKTPVQTQTVTLVAA